MKSHTTHRIIQLIIVLILVVYAYFTYIYVVAPYTSRWKARYGDVKIPEGYDIRGIDISHHQGTIDWKQLSKAQIGSEPLSFIFIKATEGTHLVDENFIENFRQAHEAGILCGAYHFFQPDISAEEQAQYYINNVRLSAGDLPPVLDIEMTGANSPRHLKDSVLVWLKRVEAAYKIKPVIYTYWKFKKENLNDATFNQYPYWIAHYYVDSISYDGEWKFWQHTDLGKLPGIKGDVDFNVYNGSMYDLKKMCLQGKENTQ